MASKPVPETQAEAYYKDYWQNQEAVREKRRYYDRLYSHLKPRLEAAARSAARILDIAGGNGHFMKYLGVSSADILDISESGLAAAKASGFRPIQGDIQKRFPIEPETYDAVFLFEVLEHLHHPNLTLAEAHHVLKKGGALYVGQPNMPADGTHHVRRYYLKPLLTDLRNAGFKIDWIDYVPAYSMRDSIWSDIRKKSKPLHRRAIQCVNLMLSFLPFSFRYRLASWVPDRFALMFVLKASKQ